MIFRISLTFLILVAELVFALPARAQQKPFTQEQLVSMVRAGLGDDSGAKLIEQRGTDFAPSEDFIQSLKAVGASEAFLKALQTTVAPGLSPARNVSPAVRSAGNVGPGLSPAPAAVAASLPRHGGVKPPLRDAALKGGSTTATPPASDKKPLNQVQVFVLLAGQVPSHRVALLVQERGIDFDPTDDYLQEVRLAGGEEELISALKTAKVTKLASIDPAAQARQAEMRQQVARGAELAKKEQYAEAEQQYRAALLLDSQSADLYESLAGTLGREERWDDST